MLVTLDFFNGTYRIANHNLDKTANFISDLALSGLSIKRGLASDTATINLAKAVLDVTVNKLVYLLLDTPVRIEFYDSGSAVFKHAIDGFISKITFKGSDIVALTVTSKVSYHMKQMFVPEIASTCQNQIFSKMCGLVKSQFKGSDTRVTIDCLTGMMDYTSALEVVHGSIDNVQLAYVVLDGHFKTRVIGVDRLNKKLYLAMNFDNLSISVDIDIYLYCNKTYGQCHTRFNNIKNFYGFAGKGQSVKNFDVFSATGLTYCGEDVAALPQDVCGTDNSIFGIKI